MQNMKIMFGRSRLRSRTWHFSIFVVCILQQRRSLHEHAAPNQELRFYGNKSMYVCKKNLIKMWAEKVQNLQNRNSTWLP